MLSGDLWCSLFQALVSQAADLPLPSTSAASLSKPSIKGSISIAVPHSESEMRLREWKEGGKYSDVTGLDWKLAKQNPINLLKGIVAGRGGVSARVE